jgi:hypothetical protein
MREVDPRAELRAGRESVPYSHRTVNEYLYAFRTHRPFDLTPSEHRILAPTELSPGTHLASNEPVMSWHSVAERGAMLRSSSYAVHSVGSGGWPLEQGYFETEVGSTQLSGAHESEELPTRSIQSFTVRYATVGRCT